VILTEQDLTGGGNGFDEVGYLVQADCGLNCAEGAPALNVNRIDSLKKESHGSTTHSIRFCWPPLLIPFTVTESSEPQPDSTVINLSSWISKRSKVLERR